MPQLRGNEPILLEKSGLAAYEHDEFKQVEMASGEKQVVGPSVIIV